MEDGREKQTQPLSLRLLQLCSDAEHMAAQYQPLFHVGCVVLEETIAEGTEYPHEKMSKLLSAEQHAECSACFDKLLRVAGACAIEERSVSAVFGTILWNLGFVSFYAHDVQTALEPLPGLMKKLQDVNQAQDTAGAIEILEDFCTAKVVLAAISAQYRNKRLTTW